MQIRWEDDIEITVAGAIGKYLLHHSNRHTPPTQDEILWWHYEDFDIAREMMTPARLELWLAGRPGCTVDEVLMHYCQKVWRILMSFEKGLDAAGEALSRAKILTPDAVLSLLNTTMPPSDMEPTHYCFQCRMPKTPRDLYQSAVDEGCGGAGRVCGTAKGGWLRSIQREDHMTPDADNTGYHQID
jgi:hypothetical protein